MADQLTGLLSPFLLAERLKAARPFLTTPLLDIGCGDGPLAGFFDPAAYMGVDIDEEALARARRLHPAHSFGRMDDLASGRVFSCIVALAVIDQVPDPKLFLASLKIRLLPGGAIVLTTPSPVFEAFYHAGSRIGLVSREAKEARCGEYDLAALTRLAAGVDLKVSHYRKFLFGANQLIVLKSK